MAGASAPAVPGVRAASIDHFVWTPNPIAPTGSLAAQTDLSFAVQAYDASNAVLTGNSIYLTYSGLHASNATFIFAGSCDGEAGGQVTLSSTPVRCSPDGTTGYLSLHFYSGATLPNGGTETFTASADAAGSLATSDSYTFATIDHFVWTPNPIAPTGSLAAQVDTSFTVKAYDNSNAVIKGGSIYLTYSGHFASNHTAIFAGTCDGEVSGQVTLSSTPVRCTPDITTGALTLHFYSGATLPNGGTETFTASADAAGSLATSDSYTFATIDHFVWTPNPIAPTESLPADTDTKFTVKAYDAGNNVIRGIPVFLSYAGRFASNGTGIFAGQCDGQVSGSVFLSSTPLRCVPDLTTGALTLNFYSGFTLPDGGTETFTAAADASGSLATSDSYTYVGPPSIAKAFSPSTILTGGTSMLTLTITNPNAGAALTGTTFTDTLPAGVVVASPANLANTCGGIATATAGTNTVSLSGGAIAASASCAVSVTVTATTHGVKNNSVQVTSTNGGTGNTATAILSVFNPTDVAITKTHVGNFTHGQNGNYTIGVSNQGDIASSGLVTVKDTLPGFMTPVIATGTGWSCSWTMTQVTCTRSSSLAGGASYPSISLAVHVSPFGAGRWVNIAKVSGGGDTFNGNNLATDPTIVN
jgi:uncharacterized repeat protein (TIGR01451 family)